jgi:hypothetical protein
VAGTLSLDILLSHLLLPTILLARILFLFCFVVAATLVIVAAFYFSHVRRRRLRPQHRLLTHPPLYEPLRPVCRYASEASYTRRLERAARNVERRVHT